MVKIEYAMMGRPFPGEFDSGDVTWSKEFNNQLLLCLIDVAGHGKLANKLAEECIGVLEANYQMDLKEIISTLDEFLKDKNRGLVLGLVLIDISTGMISYMGIGNIKTRILGKQSYRFVSRAGVLGFTKPHPKLEKYLLNHKDILLMYSDGISDKFELKNYPELLEMPINQIPEKILDRYSKNNDDSTCIAARFIYD